MCSLSSAVISLLFAEIESSKAVIIITVFEQIRWQQVKEPVGRRDQLVLVAYQAARQAGLPRRCHQAIHMPLG